MLLVGPSSPIDAGRLRTRPALNPNPNTKLSYSSMEHTCGLTPNITWCINASTLRYNLAMRTSSQNGFDDVYAHLSATYLSNTTQEIEDLKFFLK